MNNERLAEPQVGKTVFWVQICPKYERKEGGPFDTLVADGCTRCRYFELGDGTLTGACRYEASK